MSHASRTARVSNNSAAERHPEPNPRRLSHWNPKRFDSTVRGLVVCVLAVVLAICSAPTEVIRVSAQESGNEACCGMKPPSFKDFSGQTYSTFTGQIAIVTGQLKGGASVVAVDLKNESSGIPVDANWSASSSPATHLYSHPDWSSTKIGNVFGLMLDDRGNVYVTASTSYFTPHLPSGATGGEVYRIDGASGTVSTFATLPNAGPALGNIAFSCTYQSFYVTNFADGRIYQLVVDNSTSPPTGKVVSTFSHRSGVILTSFSSKNGDPEPGRNYANFIPKNPMHSTNWGRPWGLAVLGRQLFYGLWRQDTLHHDASTADNNANEIWSIGLTSNGTFTGAPTLEVTLPTLAFTNPTPFLKNYSNPVSSITLSQDGKQMLVAERSMAGDLNNSPNCSCPFAYAAHESRVLEYVRASTSSAWTPLTVATANKFGIGTAHLYATADGSRPSASGGADYDLVGGNVWAPGDALHFPGWPKPPYIGPLQSDYIYGIQGLNAMTGGNIHNSILIDLSNSTSGMDKNQMGDMEVPCPKCKIALPQMIKVPNPSCAANGNYSVTAPGTGVTYTWNVTGGTPATGTGSSMAITWGSTSPKIVTVIATNAAGCKSTITLQLKDCPK
jgi:hypothetical protein